MIENLSKRASRTNTDVIFVPTGTSKQVMLLFLEDRALSWRFSRQFEIVAHFDFLKFLLDSLIRSSSNHFLPSIRIVSQNVDVLIDTQIK